MTSARTNTHLDDCLGVSVDTPRAQPFAARSPENAVTKKLEEAGEFATTETVDVNL